MTIPTAESLDAIDEFIDAGQVAHWLLMELGVRCSVTDDGKRLSISPNPPTARALLKDWRYELEVYTKRRCDRCTKRSPALGLRQSYWGAWLCSACCRELGAMGGQLDQSGWPAHPEQRSAA